jgi:hypothetical protein
MRVPYSTPVAGLSAIRSQTFQHLFGEYGRRLIRSGYHPQVARLHLYSIVHFGVWLEREDRHLETIDDQTLEAFERHRSTCRCPGTSRNRARQVLSCVRRFVQHLREQGVVHRRLLDVPAPFRLWFHSDGGLSADVSPARRKIRAPVNLDAPREPRAHTLEIVNHQCDLRASFSRSSKYLGAQLLFLCATKPPSWTTTFGSCTSATRPSPASVPTREPTSALPGRGPDRELDGIHRRHDQHQHEQDEPGKGEPAGR